MRPSISFSKIRSSRVNRPVVLHLRHDVLWSGSMFLFLCCFLALASTEPPPGLLQRSEQDRKPDRRRTSVHGCCLCTGTRIRFLFYNNMHPPNNTASRNSPKARRYYTQYPYSRLYPI